MPNLRFILLFLLAPLFIKGQNSVDSSIIRGYLQYSKELYMDGNLDSAINLANKASITALKKGDIENYGSAQIYIGNFHYAKGELDAALDHYKITANLSSPNPDDKFTALMNLGIIYDFLGKIDSSLYYYDHSIEYADSANLPQQKGTGFLNFGSFYDDRGNSQAALRYYNKALKLLEEHGPRDKLNVTKINIGGVYEKLGRTEEAIKLYTDILNSTQETTKFVRANTYLKLTNAYLNIDSLQQANDAILHLFKILESFKDVQIRIDANLNKGRIEKKGAQYNNAISYFNRALEIAEQANLKTRLAEANYELATCYFKMGHLATAETFGGKAMNIALANKEYSRVVASAKLLAEINQSQGSIQETNQYLNQYIQYEDSLDARNSREEVNRLLLEHKEFEYQLLKKEQELQHLKLRNKEAQLGRNRIFLVGTALAAIVLLVLLTWLYRTRKKERKLNELLEQNNKKIEKQNEMLRSLNRDKDRLLHVVAHDLRNPMNAINGFIQLIEEENNLNEDQRQNIAMIKKSITHGTNIIEELLSLESEQPTKLQAEEFDITHLVEQVVMEFESTAKKKSIEIHFHPEEHTNIKNDSGKIKRITENLISNAIKFSPPGETVDVKTTGENGFVKLSVSDHGPGFTEKDKELLFKKFQKLSAQPTGGETSTGIGLAIVQDFVSLMDGKIEVDSKEGEGATVTVYIPKKVTAS